MQLKLLQNENLIQFFCTNSHNDQLLAGSIAQLVEHCTSITEAMGLNPRSSCFRLSFHNCLRGQCHYE